MNPILFSFELPLLGEVVFPAYFTLLTVGFALAILLSHREAGRQGIDQGKILDFNLYMVLFGVLGARVLHVVADGHLMEYLNTCLAPELVRMAGNMPGQCTTDAQCGPLNLCNTAAGHCHPPRDCLLALKVWRGGLTYYGGFLFAAAFGLFYIKKHNLPRWKVGDLAGFGLPLGLFWGRMGCFLNGCCFGKVTDGALGMVFPRGGAAWRHQLRAGVIQAGALAPHPVHPTQLYSALTNLGIFFICYFVIRPRKRFDGAVFWWFVILYTVSRSALEFLRDDDRGVLWGVLSTSQLISIPLIGAAIWMLRRLSRPLISRQ